MTLVIPQPVTAKEAAGLDAANDSSLAPSVAVNTNTPTNQVFNTQAILGSNPAHNLIGLTQLRQNPRYADLDGSGLAVAVLDTGIDGDHPLLVGNFRGFKDFTGGQGSADDPTLITNPTQTRDYDEHGTHVAGTVGSTDSSVGVADEVDLISLAVLGGETGSVGDILKALIWVLNHHRQYNIVCVNMSLGNSAFFTSPGNAIEAAGGAEPLFQRVIQLLAQEGVTVVSAAGNHYFSGDQFGNKEIPGIASPGIHSSLNVGAVWQDRESQIATGAFLNRQQAGPDRITVFSNRLDSPDNILDTLMAPGAMVFSTIPDNKFASFAGTSMASPHVAGVVAILQEAALRFGGRLLSVAEVTAVLKASADTIFDGDDENDNVTNTQTNYGRVNIYRAVELIDNFFNQTPPNPNPDPGPDPTPSDPNATLASAILAGTLSGQPLGQFREAIGIDGGQTTVGGKDVDMYKIELAIGGTIVVETGAVSGSGIDTILRLFSADGSQIANNDDISEANRLSRLEASNLAPGTYYVGVSGYSNNSYSPTQPLSGSDANDDGQGAYTVQFSLKSTDLNGLLANAKELALGNERSPFQDLNGNIGSDYGISVGNGDIDLFRVIIPDDGTLLIDIDTPYSNNYIDSHLRVFDANGNQVFYADGAELSSDDDLSYDVEVSANEFTDSSFPGLVFEDPSDRQFFYGHTTDSFLGAIVERGSVYYIGVSDFSNRNYNPNTLQGRNAIGQGGDYRLKVNFFSNDRNGTIDRAIDIGASELRFQPGAIGTDTDQDSGAESNVGDLDVDMLRVTPNQSGLMHIDIDAYGENAGIDNPVDAIITIFDANGRRIAEMDDEGDELDPNLFVDVIAGESYYVGISGYGNAGFDALLSGSGSSGDTGEYLISITYESGASAGRDEKISSNFVQSNTINLPGPRSAPLRRSGHLGYDGDAYRGGSDIDLYRFQAGFSAPYIFMTQASSEYSADTVLRMFNESGSELAFNDDVSAKSKDSQIQLNLSAGQVVYVGVNGYSSSARDYSPITGQGSSGGSLGAYDLIVQYGGNDLEPLSLTASTAQVLYVAYYGRPADASGLEFWQSTIAAAGFSYSPINNDLLTPAERPLYDRIVGDFGDQQESRDLYAGKTAKECADAVYNNCFGRDAEIDPLTNANFWVDKLENGQITLSQLASEVALGARGDDLDYLRKKAESANVFYRALDSANARETYAGSSDSRLAREWLSQFGSTIAATSEADFILGLIADAT